MAEEMRRQVKRRYAGVARQAAGGGGSCCGAGCCSDATCPGGYSAEELADLPKDLASVSLGCGNPTALADLRPGDVVLDLGSGGGLDAFLAARKVGEKGMVYGLDMTPEMMRLARRNQEKLGAENVKFIGGEMEHIPLADESVDVILSNCVINLAPDKSTVFRECYRVLRPDGRLAVADTMWSDPIPDWLSQDAQLWTSCVAGALTEAEYRRLLAEAGFTAVDVNTLSRLDDWVPPDEDLRRRLAGECGSRVPSLMGAFVSARKPG